MEERDSKTRNEIEKIDKNQTLSAKRKWKIDRYTQRRTKTEMRNGMWEHGQKGRKKIKIKRQNVWVEAMRILHCMLQIGMQYSVCDDGWWRGSDNEFCVCDWVKPRQSISSVLDELPATPIRHFRCVAVLMTDVADTPESIRWDSGLPQVVHCDTRHFFWSEFYWYRYNKHCNSLHQPQYRVYTDYCRHRIHEYIRRML